MNPHPSAMRLFQGFALTIVQTVWAEPTALFLVSVEGKWGYIDRTGRVVIQPQFVQARAFSEGLAVVEVAGTSEEDRARETTYEGFIRPDGVFAIPPRAPEGVRNLKEYRSYSFYDFHEGLARVHVNDATGMSGYIDRTGAVVIAPQFGTAGDFSEGLVFVETKRYLEKDPAPSRNGFIDKTGKWVIENQRITFAHAFADGRAVASVNARDPLGDACMIDKKGEFVIFPGTYICLSSPTKGLIRACRNKKVGLLNLDGRVIVPFGAYDQIYEPETGSTFVAEKSGAVFLLDATGTRVARVESEGDVGRFKDGMASIGRNGKFGYIDETGRLAIPMDFDKAELFDQGLALVTRGTNRGYINRTGEFVWKTERWDEPVRNSVSKPLSTFLPGGTTEALPLSYNWKGVKNAIVFAADGSLEEMQEWYRKRCSGKTKLSDHTDYKNEPGKMDLLILQPGKPELEVYAVEGAAPIAEGFVEFYFCKNMVSLHKKHPRKVVGILIQN